MPHSIIINIILIILHQIVIEKMHISKDVDNTLCDILCRGCKQTKTCLTILNANYWHTKVKIVCLSNNHAKMLNQLKKQQKKNDILLNKLQALWIIVLKSKSKRRREKKNQ